MHDWRSESERERSHIDLSLSRALQERVRGLAEDVHRLKEEIAEFLRSGHERIGALGHPTDRYRVSSPSGPTLIHDDWRSP
jgi:hypothetical protein